MGRYWYSYVGTAGTAPSLVAANYRRITLNHGKPNCDGINQICAIYSPSGDSTPTSPLSSNLQAYITAALSSTSSFEPQTGKAFVYKKP